MNRDWVFVKPRRGSAWLATMSGLLITLIPLAMRYGADSDDVQKVVLAAVICGLLAGVSAMPTWIIVVIARPTFWNGARLAS